MPMENPTMTLGQWAKRLTFYEILIGMKATITVFIQRIILRNRPAVTLQYPHEKRDLPGSYRGMIALLRYDDETETGVGGLQQARPAAEQAATACSGGSQLSGA